MGEDSDLLAKNAVVAVKSGACGIGLNFGCPAKVVNHYHAGSSLLQYPEQVHQIVKSVLDFVPSSIPVKAKIRLGDRDDSLAFENVLAV